MIRKSDFSPPSTKVKQVERITTSLSPTDLSAPPQRPTFTTAGFHLFLLTLADLIARTAYQMGKTPLLPLFAATLGAGELYLGFISSVSTFTGLVLKPAVGMLSDRQGRWRWLLIGTAFFVVMPFAYRFINTPEQLVAVRLVHGLATAIYGPVTLAMVVSMGDQNKAARVGMFSIGRSGGYIFGPAIAGFLLLIMAPVELFTIIGYLSSFALLPVLLMAEDKSEKCQHTKRIPWRQQLRIGIANSAYTPAIWIAGSFEAINYMVTYTAKAFLPIYALAVGRNTLEAGLFFTVQQAVTMLAKPSLAWIADRHSYRLTIGLAIIGLGCGLIMLTFSANVIIFFAAALLLGLAEGLIVPAATALVSNQIEKAHTGIGLGFMGALQNGSKVVGPILAGFLIAIAGYEFTFRLMAAVAFVAGLTLIIWQHHQDKTYKAAL